MRSLFLETKKKPGSMALPMVEEMGRQWGRSAHAQAVYQLGELDCSVCGLAKWDCVNNCMSGDDNCKVIRHPNVWDQYRRNFEKRDMEYDNYAATHMAVYGMSAYALRKLQNPIKYPDSDSTYSDSEDTGASSLSEDEEGDFCGSPQANQKEYNDVSPTVKPAPSNNGGMRNLFGKK